jgi:hypothetical protein
MEFISYRFIISAEIPSSSHLCPITHFYSSLCTSTLYIHTIRLLIFVENINVISHKLRVVRVNRTDNLSYPLDQYS